MRKLFKVAGLFTLFLGLLFIGTGETKECTSLINQEQDITNSAVEHVRNRSGTLVNLALHEALKFDTNYFQGIDPDTERGNTFDGTDERAEKSPVAKLKKEGEVFLHSGLDPTTTRVTPTNGKVIAGSDGFVQGVYGLVRIRTG